MRTEFVKSSGHEFFVRLWGDPKNPPLMLLHGFPEHSGAWQQVAELLEDDYYCIAPDQRGYGRSAKPKGVKHYRASELAGDVIGLISHYAPNGQIALLGHDWGAAVAYTVAITVPKMLNKLIILNGVHPIAFQDELAKGGAQAKASQYMIWLRQAESTKILAANGFEKLIGLIGNGMNIDWLQGEILQQYKAAWQDEAGLDAMINWYRASPIRVPQLGQTFDAADMVALNADDMRISMPHLVIWGEDDGALLPETRDAIYNLCDDVKIHKLSQADHWLHHQKPDKVAAAIGDFL